MSQIDYQALQQLIYNRNGHEQRARQLNIQLAQEFGDFAKLEARGDLHAALIDHPDRCRNVIQSFAYLRGDTEHEYWGPDRQR